VNDIGKTPEVVWEDALDDVAMRRENGWAGFGSSPPLHDMFPHVAGSSFTSRQDIRRCAAGL
jgi:hypothetical protein